MIAVKKRHRHRRTRYNYDEHEGWDCEPDSFRMRRSFVLGFYVLLGVALVCWLASSTTDPRIERRLPPVLGR